SAAARSSFLDSLRPGPSRYDAVSSTSFMPSRNRPEKDDEAASLAPNDTGCSPNSFSAMAPRPAPHNSGHKSLPAGGESSAGYEKVKTWVPARRFAPKRDSGALCWGLGAKKEPPLPAARSDNREASNRVDRSHSVSRRWTLIVIKEKA